MPHAGHSAPERGAPQLEQNFPPPGAPQDGQAVADVLVMVTKLVSLGQVNILSEAKDLARKWLEELTP